MNFQSKLPQTGTTIFSVMSKLAAEHQAFNLSQGFPNFPCADELIELIYQNLKAGHNQYAPMPGVLALREILAQKINELYQGDYNPDTEITITAGATQALYTAISTLVHPGDEVIVIEPSYDSYVPAILLNGGVPVYVQLRAPDFQLNWDEVRSKISTRTKLIIVNTPHNPTGAIFSAADLETLTQIATEHNLFVLSDEVYEHITFDDKPHESIAKYPALKERTFACFSFGKVFHVTGWKIGYCIGPAWLMKEFRKIHQFEVFSVNTPIQYALASYLKNRSTYLELPAFFQAKRDKILEQLKNSSFGLTPAAGTYFQLLHYGNISQEKDTDFAIRLTKELGVASIPISVFYHDGRDEKMIRLCFAKTDELLDQAIPRLQQL